MINTPRRHETVWAPPACTLPTAERPLRVTEFEALFASALRAVHRPAATQLELLFDPAAESQLRDLTARESECCTFFRFTFGRSANHLRLRIEVPEQQRAVLDALAALAGPDERRRPRARR
jgi:hypothetical protein